MHLRRCLANIKLEIHLKKKAIQQKSMDIEPITYDQAFLITLL